jgi:hypothetical protein
MTYVANKTFRAIAPKLSEHHEQASFFDWLWMFKLNEHPELHPLMFAVPNGAHLAGNAQQRAAKMNKLKAEGFTPGVADTIFLSARGGNFGLALEFKTPDREHEKDGGLSEQQSEFLRAARVEGFVAEVAYGADHAIRIVGEYLSRPTTQDMIYRALKYAEEGNLEACKSLLKEVTLAW